MRAACAAGHQVVVYDALTYAACATTLAGYRVQFVHGNICDADLVAQVFATYHPDVVMHLAAESHVDRSIDGPGDFIDTNIIGTFTLLEAARTYWHSQGRPKGFRFHHVSTDEVYGSLGATGLFDEASAYAPNSPYAASKAASDHLVRAWGETYGLPVVISNCSNNYGPFQFPEKLIPVVILAALAGDPIPIYGAGDNVRDWLFVDDHASALLCILRKGQAGRCYAVGARAEATNLDIAHRLCKILDHKSPKERPYSSQITPVIDRPGHDQRYGINPARIEDELGWRAAVTLDQGLVQTVDWYLANQAWWQPLQSRLNSGAHLGGGDTGLGQAA